MSLVLMVVGLAAAEARAVWINGEPLDRTERRELARAEAAVHARLPAGSYWYDAASGAIGRVGSGTEGFLPPGLALADRPLPVDASGVTGGVRVNGRALPAAERAWIEARTGFLVDGAYSLDAAGMLRAPWWEVGVSLPALAPRRAEGEPRS